MSLGLLMLTLGAVQAATVTRGPYLQMGTPDAMTVRWRTDVPSDAQVRYGTQVDNLDQTAVVAQQNTNHVVRLTHLQAATRYYYSIGSSSEIWRQDADMYFRTAPAYGSTGSMRVWVIGDAGTANDNARAVYQAYQKVTENSYTDLWLMLGDNAYNSGKDSEYQRAVFDMYPTLLRQTPLWSTIGNHDASAADSSSETGPYYDIFTLPRAAEAGGVASGTEAYYSFNYAHVHFICLDSHDTPRAVDGAMYKWLEADIAANTQAWTIAFWHHPPYTKGSHDSDKDKRLIEMREHFLPLLEANGVDLILTGHSHSYERSMLLDGHYGDAASFDKVGMAVDDGDGSLDGDGAYRKTNNRAAHQGAVYTVAGSSGKTSGGPLNHPAMKVSLNKLGSLILEIEDQQLTAVFLDDKAQVRDHYTLIKSANVPPTIKLDLPQADAVFSATDTVQINAVAADADNALASVIFYANEKEIGIDESAPYAMSWQHPEPGIYVLRARAIDALGARQISAPVPVTVTTKDGAMALSRRVVIGNDDAEEAANGSVSTASSDLELVRDASDQMIGLRFQQITVPAGARIQSAFIQFTVDKKNNETTALSIRAQAIGQAPVFSRKKYNITQRTLTSAEVSWAPVSWTDIGAATDAQQTPDLAIIVQELIDRDDWHSGQAMVFTIKGTGKRVAKSHNGSALEAAQLSITWLAEGTPAQKQP